jgi:GMP synthase-like glutamine amidotransferase
MRAHTLQHVPFEGLGLIEHWLDQAGYDFSVTRFFESEELPDPASIQLLIILGGPMSVNNEREYPWLVREKAFIRKCIEAGIPTLGICLGAQLIASVLGAQVYRSAMQEIGWFPVMGTPTALVTSFEFPKTTPVFHWHGETFDLPEGAIHLAKSAVCRNQAFQFGDTVIAIQFHPEMTPRAARALVEACGDELVPSQYVNSESQMLSVPAKNYKEANDLLVEVLKFLTDPARKTLAGSTFGGVSPAPLI